MEAGLQVTRCCRAKAQSCDTNCGPCKQGLACRISLSQSGGMHYDSARVSTDDQNTALQRAVLKRGRMHDDLHGRRSFRCDGAALCPHPLPHSPPVSVATGMCRACLPGRSHPWCVTHLGRGVRARERVTQAVDSWSGVLGRDSDTPRTGEAAVAGPRSPVPLARRAHPWYRLCATRVFQGDCHERAPWYAAHPPVSTPFSPATIAINHDPALRDTIWLLQKTGRSPKKRYGVHQRRSHQQRKKARAAKRKVQTPVGCSRRVTVLFTYMRSEADCVWEITGQRASTRWRDQPCSEHVRGDSFISQGVSRPNTVAWTPHWCK